MDIQEILARVDRFYEENRGEEAEKLMLDSISQAVQEQDDSSLLQLLNELLGYYRETSRNEEAFRIAEQAIAQAERMGLQGTIPYATTLLNVANAYRAGERLIESLECYLQVQELYNSLFSSENMLVAGLQNNMSLLYQEMGEYGKAKICLLRALEIVEKEDATYEVAVTCANLAATCVQLGDLVEAVKYAGRAVTLFQELGVEDSHYAAAVAALGAIYFQKKEHRVALEYYEQAAGIVERSIGRNEDYRRLLEYIAACRQTLTDENIIGDESDIMPLAGESYALPEDSFEPENRSGKDDSVAWTADTSHENDTVQEDSGETADIAPESDTAQESIEEACSVQENDTVQEDSSETADIAPENNTAQEGIEEGSATGLALCRAYYETYGRPMIAEQFGDYENRIAVGLVGRGSDCFGYDDETSRDHDWGPGFCMWVTDETYEEIGEALQQAYKQLPEEFQGYRHAPQVSAKKRRGVMRISAFYRELVGAEKYEEIDWRQVADHSLAAAVNGQVFRDEEGIFTAFRKKLLEGYPEQIRYLKLAESAAGFAQTAQYNFSRMLQRGDWLTARMMVWDGAKAAMKLQHYIEGKYPPHDKWLRRSMEESRAGIDVGELLKQVTATVDNQEEKVLDALQAIEKLGEYFAMEMYGLNLISDIDSYLDAHSQELVYKASLAEKSISELSEEIAKLEFEAFDKVRNEGGRASCQNDWHTFSIMRKSQYLTWNKTMLMQYLYDFHREYGRGHNLIEEKYGRMMESTAPEKYREISEYFPELSEEKKAIIQQICGMQVGWMEEFAQKYPALADNARSIHTYEDNPFDTSYETYLRGELGTYSDKMLELYGRYIVGYANSGRNPAEDIMGNSVKMYGYADIEEAERKTKAAY